MLPPLTAVSGGSISASFVYDADGNRVKGTVNGTTTVYIAGLYEYQGGATTLYYEGNALRRTGYATDNGVFYLLQDQLKSSSVLANQNGTVNSRNYFYPFGGNRGGAAFSSLTTKRFTGQYHEQGLPGGEGLSYYGARWYDAQLGRFASPDSIVPGAGNPQAFNRYSYANNNPVRYLDPTGHVANCFCTMQQDAGGGGGSSAAGTGGSWWTPVSDFFYGGLAQWGYNNSWYAPAYQTRFAEQSYESVATAVGRHTANFVSMAQGGIELIGGGGLGATGAAACGTGVLCLAGAPAIAGGAALVTHGGTVAGVGALEEGRMLGNVVMARSGGNEWKIGDPIDQTDANGSYPSWETVRSRYWQNRADSAGWGEFSRQNLGLMKRGNAPMVRIIARLRDSGQEVDMLVSKELHHITGRGGVDPHTATNLVEAWPWEHEEMDPYRRLNYDFVGFK